MSKIVFVLGAGASAHTGVPVMKDFLAVARELLDSGQVEEVRQDFEKVLLAIGVLQGVNVHANLDTYNIETVYAAFEMAESLAWLPKIGGVKWPKGLTASTARVIAYTLERTMHLTGSIGQEAPKNGYNQFATMVGGRFNSRGDCCVISFNWDLGLDYALQRSGPEFDYCLEDEGEGERKAMPYLKLHGSLNWVPPQSRAKRVTPVMRFEPAMDRPREGHPILPVVSELRREFAADPVIVPPTWNKSQFFGHVAPVWRRALRELSDAENIFVLGYSLPPTDFFFNHLFAFGMDMRTVLSRFWVWDIEPEGGIVDQRFRALLGSGVIRSYRYQQSSFDAAVFQTPGALPLVPTVQPNNVKQALAKC